MATKDILSLKDQRVLFFSLYRVINIILEVSKAANSIASGNNNINNNNNNKNNENNNNIDYNK